MSNPPGSITPLEVRWPAINADLYVYVLQGETLGLVDTAAPGASLAEALATRGHTPADIGLVLNTHAHPDHSGGNGAVKTASAAQICMHKDDADCAEDPGHCFDRFFDLRTRLLRGDDAAPVERAAYVEEMGGSLPVDRVLEDGEILDLGGSLQIRVVHLPGHTPGSSGFLWEAGGVLIAGDSVAGLGTPEGSLPLIFDLDAYRASVDRLLQLSIDRLYTSHPYRGLRVPPATVREGAEVRVFLEDAKEFAARLSEIFQTQTEHGENETLLEIADAVIEALPPETGHKKLAELPYPDFTATTVVWGLRDRWDTGNR